MLHMWENCIRVIECTFLLLTTNNTDNTLRNIRYCLQLIFSIHNFLCRSVEYFSFHYCAGCTRQHNMFKINNFNEMHHVLRYSDFEKCEFRFEIRVKIYYVGSI